MRLNPAPIRHIDFVHGNKIAPSAGWNGTAGSGFGGLYGAVPTDPTRTTAKPACRLLVPDRQAFTDRVMVGVYAGANDGGSLLDTMGLTSVTFHYEGSTKVVTRPTFQWITDANGTVRQYFGFWCLLEHNGTNGTANLYVEAVPRDGTMQARVMGPYVFLPRAVQHDYDLTVAATGAIVAGVSYRTVKAALEYLASVSAQHPRITITEAGTYALDLIAIPYSGGAGRCTIRASAAVTFGKPDEASKGQFRPRYSALHFQGDNITFDARYVSDVRLDEAIGPWLDGVNLTNSGGRYSLWNKGKRPNGFFIRGAAWFTECSFTNLLNACLCNESAHVRGCILNTVADDIFSNAALVIGSTVDDANSIEWKTNLPAMTVHYTGAGTTATTSLTGGNDDASRTFTCKVNGASVGSIVLQNTNPAGAYYDIADVVDWINTTLGALGWTATLLDDTRRATALAKASATFGWSDYDCKTAVQTLIAKFDLHGDWYQTAAALENVVLADNYSINLETQDIFFTAYGCKDFLVVNNVWHDGDLYGYSSQLSAAHSHVVFVHNTWASQGLRHRLDTDLGIYNPDAYCLFANNTVPALVTATSDADPVAVGNHYQDGATAYGTSATVGGTEATLFADAAAGDFTPAGALASNLKTTRMKYDRAAVARGSTAPAGALAA